MPMQATYYMQNWWQCYLMSRPLQTLVAIRLIRPTAHSASPLARPHGKHSIPTTILDLYLHLEIETTETERAKPTLTKEVEIQPFLVSYHRRATLVNFSPRTTLLNSSLSIILQTPHLPTFAEKSRLSFSWRFNCSWCYNVTAHHVVGISTSSPEQCKSLEL